MHNLDRSSLAWSTLVFVIRFGGLLVHQCASAASASISKGQDMAASPHRHHTAVLFIRDRMLPGLSECSEILNLDDCNPLSQSHERAPWLFEPSVACRLPVRSVRQIPPIVRCERGIWHLQQSPFSGKGPPIPIRRQSTIASGRQ